MVRDSKNIKVDNNRWEEFARIWTFPLNERTRNAAAAVLWHDPLVYESKDVSAFVGVVMLYNK